MVLPLAVEAVSFFLAFSALPVSIIYYVKSRETWILPYIAIQLVMVGYASVDVLLVGAGRMVSSDADLPLLLWLETALRIALLVLVPLFLNVLLELGRKRLRMTVWSVCAAGSAVVLAIATTMGGSMSFASPAYLCVAAGSVALAVYTVLVAIQATSTLRGAIGITNKLFILAGPIYVLYLVAFTVFPLCTGSVLRFLGVSFTNVAYGVWNLVFLRFLLEFITAKPLSARDTATVESFLQSVELTEREMEIVRGVIRGLSNKQIAYELSISEGTVKAHLFRAFQKVGIHTRVELMNAIYSRQPSAS